MRHGFASVAILVAALFRHPYRIFYVCRQAGTVLLGTSVCQSRRQFLADRR